MENVSDGVMRFSLDFDEAYQYVSAEKFGLTLISVDADFDRTEKGRKSPENFLNIEAKKNSL